MWSKNKSERWRYVLLNPVFLYFRNYGKVDCRANAKKWSITQWIPDWMKWFFFYFSKWFFTFQSISFLPIKCIQLLIIFHLYVLIWFVIPNNCSLWSAMSVLYFVEQNICEQFYFWIQLNSFDKNKCHTFNDIFIDFP